MSGNARRLAAGDEFVYVNSAEERLRDRVTVALIVRGDETKEVRVEFDETVGDDAPKVDEEERSELVLHRRSLLKRVGLGAAAFTIPSAVVAGPAFGAVTDALAADSFIKSHPKWKFVSSIT